MGRVVRKLVDRNFRPVPEMWLGGVNTEKLVNLSNQRMRILLD